MIPQKTADLLAKIMADYDLTEEAVGLRLGIGRRSVRRLLQGGRPSGKVVVALIRLYLQLSSDTLTTP